jgi:hypothetical protein
VKPVEEVARGSARSCGGRNQAVKLGRVWEIVERALRRDVRRDQRFRSFLGAGSPKSEPVSRAAGSLVMGRSPGRMARGWAVARWSSWARKPS